MDSISDLSRDKILYVCDNEACRVVTFVPGEVEVNVTDKSKLTTKVDHCPSCGNIGLVLRGPIPDPTVRSADAAETV